MTILDKVNYPQDIKDLSIEELNELASDIRTFLIDSVSKTGGHLASSLGAVELTLAMHYVFDTPKDKFLFDVGHQSYVHKILTGRKDKFDTLRKYKGLSGFTKPTESEHDAFIAGHSSTVISAGLGMAVARDLKGEDFSVVSLVGDGSLTAGMAFEGLNNAGHLKNKFIVILNDNEMSISKNVGALSAFLSRKITGRFATRVKKEIDLFLKSIPKFGDSLSGFLKKAEDSIITLFTPGMIFEGLGFHYIGPIKGHDLEGLIKVLEESKNTEGPVFIHVMTEKGKGYEFAEKDPATFHGVGPFDKATGIVAKGKGTSYTKVFGDSLIELAEKNDKIIGLTAAMSTGTGLVEFSEKFPDRFFDVGIAEQHCLTFAAGLATQGYIPVCAIYSTFMQRAFDQLIHDVCLQKLPVIICLDRAGLVGADGPTHHGTFDISFLREIPNLVIMAPKDGTELKSMLKSAVSYNAPVVIRYPRGNVPDETLGEAFDVEKGKAEIISEGKDLQILAIGNMVEEARVACTKLNKEGFSVGVTNMRFVKPIDEEAILHASKTGQILTVEENSLMAGFGSSVTEFLAAKDIKCTVKCLGLPDEFIEHGTQAELKKPLSLDAEGIYENVVLLLKDKKAKIAN